MKNLKLESELASKIENNSCCFPLFQKDDSDKSSRDQNKDNTQVKVIRELVWLFENPLKVSTWIFSCYM